jgi:hypothetical protein
MPSEFSSNSQLKNAADQVLDKDGNGILDTFESPDESSSLNNSSLSNRALGWDDGFERPSQLKWDKASNENIGSPSVDSDLEGGRVLKFARNGSELENVSEVESGSINPKAEKRAIDAQKISEDVIRLSEATGPEMPGLGSLRMKVIERIASQKIDLGAFKSAAEAALKAA